MTILYAHLASIGYSIKAQLRKFIWHMLNFLNITINIDCFYFILFYKLHNMANVISIDKIIHRLTLKKSSIYYH